MATNWSRPIDLKRQFGFSQSTVDSAWHGRPIGLAPFLRICRAMKISPLDFLGDEK
ncbi:MAG: helix-turn-helix domain-containing protein [Devosia sp.]|uniref:helix-turn-helix domain-containing protein n=1 Tax=Devosia sp. TaxID=1871048 RepID=UPI0033973208